MDEVKFAKFPDEFNVAKHLDLGNGTLLLLLRSKRVVMFVIDWGEKIIRGKQQKGYVTTPRGPLGRFTKTNGLTFNISGAVLKFILKLGNQQSSEGLQKPDKTQCFNS